MNRFRICITYVILLTSQSFYSFSYSQNHTNKFVENDNMALGNPSHASANTDSANNYLMVKPQYCQSYNNSKHIPNWVSWHLQASDLGNIKRQNDFRSDNTLPIGWYHVSPNDYKNSGFDKGHMCPSGDRTSTFENNSSTFFMTNMIPQAPNNNRITWEQLESYCRTLVNAGNELYIICGGYGMGGSGSKGYLNSIANAVIVPKHTWKIIIELPEGKEDINRINKNTRVIAVLMPNSQSCSKKSWDMYRTTIKQIESLTGYNFLSNVPEDVQKVVEVKIDTVTIK